MIRSITASFILSLFLTQFAAGSSPAVPLRADQFGNDNGQLPIWATAEELEQTHPGEPGINSPPPGQVRCPAEFEKREGILFTWDFGSWEDIYLSMVDAIQDVATCYIVTTNEQSVKNAIQGAGLSLTNVEFINESTNSVWIRDYGPWFVSRQNGSWGITDFEYNRPRPLDDAFPGELATLWGLPHYESTLEHAGGNFFVDGMGTCYASSLVDDENSFGYSEIAAVFDEYTGSDTFHMMDKTSVEYTGHIDMFFKLLTPNTVLLGEYDDPGGNDYNVIESNKELLMGVSGPYGRPYKFVRCPMPDVYGGGVVRSFTNSLIVNGRVLLPVYSTDLDDYAIAIHEEAMPGYTIVPIECSDIIQSGGAIHCIAIGVPDTDLVSLIHTPFLDLQSNGGADGAYSIEAEVKAAYGHSVSSVSLFWSDSPDGQFTEEEMGSSGGITYTCNFTAQGDGETVYYYIEATDDAGNFSRSPYASPEQLHHFVCGQRILLTVNAKDSFIHKGETLEIDVTLESYSDDTEDVVGRADLYFQNGQAYSGNPVAGPYSFSMQTGQVISTTVSHPLPLQMPDQLYYYEVTLERPGGELRTSEKIHFLVKD